MIKREENASAGTDFRKVISVILNIMIVAFAVTGTVIMLTHRGDGKGLTSSGIENLKRKNFRFNVCLRKGWQNKVASESWSGAAVL